MILISDFIHHFPNYFLAYTGMLPWKFTQKLPAIIAGYLAQPDGEYTVQDGIAVHKTAIIEQGAILKPPVFIGANCFVGAHAYLRGGVFLSNAVKIGTACEIKASIIFDNSSIAHFNFIGDSIIGSKVNFEAGSITANHFNERADKNIYAFYQSQKIDTGTIKFGALVGDNCRIGANAVLSPGTILPPATIVKRLELIEQRL